MSMLNLESFCETSLETEPYEYLVLPGFVRADCLKQIDADFPKIEQGGSFPLASLSFGGAFAELGDELLGENVKAAFSDKFGLDLSGRPATLTVRGRCRAKDGKVHTDSRSKLITALIYLNDGWSGGGGQLRLLRSNNIEDVIAEVPPYAGTLICFRNRENAWHGHTSYEGPRRALQLNWVVDDAAARKSERRHGLSARLKNFSRSLFSRT
jgi:SM-20-related protein